MCFSATASFVAAGGLAVIGAATIAQRPPLRMAALAATPLLFAVHQSIEGAVRLSLDGGEPSQALVKSWVFIAEVFWPTFTPIAVLLMTRGRRRRQGLAALAVTGVIVSAYFLNVLLRSDFTVAAVDGNLSYRPDEPAARNLPGLYLMATVAPLLIARERFVFAFGLAVLAGAIATELYFSHAGPSVWCFFAAVASACAFLAVRDEKAGPRGFRSPQPKM
jgi:hypothetical protein